MATVTEDQFTRWLQGIGGLGGSGVLLWYLWYDVSKVKPRMERQHREQMAEQAAMYAAQAKATEERHAANWALATANNRADLKEIISGFRTDHDKLAQSVNKNAEAVDRLTELVNTRDCKYGRESHGSA